MSFARSALLILAAIGASGSALATDGAAVYNQNCAMCHAQGIANAPKPGDKAGWEVRLKQGRDALIANAIKGKGGMPPRGMNPKLSDAEIAASVDHMLASLK